MLFPSTPAGAQLHSVLVADPHCCVREGLKTILGAQPDLRVVGEASDGPTTLSLASDLNPDLVIVETSLPGLDGAQVAARLGGERKVLVLTACEHVGTARLVLGVGARGYVLKRSSPEHLLQAVRAVAAGGTYIDPEMAGSLVGTFLGAGEERPAVALSEREVQVVRMIALGYSNKEIAAKLKVSVKTVETYKSRSMEKLQMRSRVDIVRFAAKSGWLEDIDQPVVVTRDGSA
jgi:two-component system, NarL family, response regulator NreC